MAFAQPPDRWWVFNASATWCIMHKVCIKWHNIWQSIKHTSNFLLRPLGLVFSLTLSLTLSHSLSHSLSLFSSHFKPTIKQHDWNQIADITLNYCSSLNDVTNTFIQFHLQFPFQASLRWEYLTMSSSSCKGTCTAASSRYQA